MVQNKQCLRRWNQFISKKRNVYASVLFLIFIFLSITAELFANNKPHILIYNGNFYIPLIKDYRPSDLNINSEALNIDYKSLKMKRGDFALWPVIRWDPYESNTKVDRYPSPPSRENWMGTDDRGRDVLTRVLYGFRYSMGFAFCVWLGSFFLGSLLGMIMGFKGGLVDLFGQRFVEIFEFIPYLLVLIIVISFLGASFPLLVFISIVLGWVNISWYMRSEFLKLRKLEFVQSAQSYGMGSFGIMFKHILPNALVPIITFTPFKLAGGVVSLSILDYLGFGLPPPTPSWGELLSQAEQYFTIGWWLATFPSLFLFLTLLSLIFIGEGVRSAFDQKESLTY